MPSSRPAGSLRDVLPSLLVQKLLDPFVLCPLADGRHPRHKIALLCSSDVTVDDISGVTVDVTVDFTGGVMVQSHNPVWDHVHRVLPLGEREEGG